MAKIKDIKARQILDSRGNPTIEVDVFTDNGFSRAAVPSGASTGIYEAHELRDNNSKKFNGKGVEKAIANVALILKAIKGMDCEQQREIDKIIIDLDGTDNKSKLGANAMLAVSLAVARAGAKSKGKQLYEHLAELARNKDLKLPIPSFNVINGGAHAGNELEFQEYMIMPVGAKTFSEALRIGAEVYAKLKQILKSKYGKDATNVGDEGGFAPPVKKIEEPLNLMIKAAKAAGHFKKIKFAMDVAASEFYKNGYYVLNGKHLKAEELMHIYLGLIEKYPIISIEDPFDQEDFESFAKLKELAKGVQIVGDDLLVTNSKRIISALTNNSCNALLLKVNQIGTLTEALDAAKLAMDNGWNVMVSHRSGETTDDFIADLAVGLGSGQIKSGAPCRGERLAKYNQLLRIEECLGKKAKYSEFKIK